MIGDPVADAAHGVLADAEAQVAAGLVGAEVGLALDVGQVRFGQVRGAAEQLRHRGASAWIASWLALRVATSVPSS